MRASSANSTGHLIPMPSDVNRLHIIEPKTHATHWTLAVTTFNNSLYTGIAEQMIAFCNDS
ncbi:hypothetical protein OIU78_015910, partial [Salix suchowensis]